MITKIQHFIKCKKTFNKDLKELNSYFDNLDQENDITNNRSNIAFLYEKKKDVNNYIYNSIVNYAINKYNNPNSKDKIKVEDLIHEIVLTKNIDNTKKNKTKRKQFVKNYYKNRNNNFIFPSKYEIERAFLNLKYEMDKSAELFYEMFEEE